MWDFVSCIIFIEDYGALKIVACLLSLQKFLTATRLVDMTEYSAWIAAVSSLMTASLPGLMSQV